MKLDSHEPSLRLRWLRHVTGCGLLHAIVQEREVLIRQIVVSRASEQKVERDDLERTMM